MEAEDIFGCRPSNRRADNHERRVTGSGLSQPLQVRGAQTEAWLTRRSFHPSFCIHVSDHSTLKNDEVGDHHCPYMRMFINERVSWSVCRLYEVQRHQATFMRSQTAPKESNAGRTSRMEKRYVSLSSSPS